MFRFVRHELIPQCQTLGGVFQAEDESASGLRGGIRWAIRLRCGWCFAALGVSDLSIGMCLHSMSVGSGNLQLASKDDEVCSTSPGRLCDTSVMEKYSHWTVVFPKSMPVVLFCLYILINCCDLHDVSLNDYFGNEQVLTLPATLLVIGVSISFYI